MRFVHCLPLFLVVAIGDRPIGVLPIDRDSLSAGPSVGLGLSFAPSLGRDETHNGGGFRPFQATLGCAAGNEPARGFVVFRWENSSRVMASCHITAVSSSSTVRLMCAVAFASSRCLRKCPVPSRTARFPCHSAARCASAALHRRWAVAVNSSVVAGSCSRVWLGVYLSVTDIDI